MSCGRSYWTLPAWLQSASPYGDVRQVEGASERLAQDIPVIYLDESSQHSTHQGVCWYGRGRTSASALERKHGEYCDALLADALSAKESERELLDGLIDPQAMWTRVKAPLDARVAEILASRRTLKVVPVPNGEPGEVQYDGWEVSTVAVRQSFEIREDAVAFAFRAISIVEGRHIAQRSKLDRKKEIAKSADVEMADATKPGPSIQSMVDRAVSARFKKALPTVSRDLHFAYPVLTSRL
ncbi:hypothetical protein CPB84DRAFT_1688157 [Gymnopilus junonius]|uniref:Uncharacterized protein n=1 Tax=Gymnopilus junonius TaxID=109634 RepID=A0A9P5NBK8_GYMJU|nr:hypothetical protein CPB84DRAFT_1688157 [Gymnopilus junonius]